eukprot:4469499-Lingulodinium_polyedra.AAC.1
MLIFIFEEILGMRLSLQREGAKGKSLYLASSEAASRAVNSDMGALGIPLAAETRWLGVDYSLGG